MYRILVSIFILSKGVAQFDLYDLRNYTPQADSVSLEAPVKAMFKSLILPGWGQLQNEDNWWKPVMFAGIETIGIISSLNFGNQAEEIRKRFETYGDDHWDLERWFNNTKIIFPDRWEEIIVGTHKLGLKIDNNYFYTDQLSNLISKYSWSEITVIRDRDFYENIGKYDQFVGGWDDPYDNPFDSEGNWYTVKKGDVESVILTKRKDAYRGKRHESNLLKHYSRYAISVVMFNHLVSGMEAAWVANKKSDSPTRLNLKFEPINKWGVGGVQIIYAW